MADETGTTAPPTTGITLQVYVPTGEARAARDFYSRLFGREPEFEPHDDFFEWAPITGQECWFQVSGHDDPATLTNRVRLRVAALVGAVQFLDLQDIPHSEPSQLPGVVAFVDFSDPWGNHLGYYEDLVPSGQQQEYRGTSVSDETQFADFPVQ
ncbi:MAG: VOC family protein [Janibacter sp.]